MKSYMDTITVVIVKKKIIISLITVILLTVGFLGVNLFTDNYSVFISSGYVIRGTNAAELVCKDFCIRNKHTGATWWYRIPFVGTHDF